MKTNKLPSGNYRVVIAIGYDEHGKRKYKSFTADEEWKVVKMATDYKRGEYVDQYDNRNLTVVKIQSKSNRKK